MASSNPAEVNSLSTLARALAASGHTLVGVLSLRSALSAAVALSRNVLVRVRRVSTMLAAVVLVGVGYLGGDCLADGAALAAP